MASITVTLHDGELPLQRVTVGVTDAIHILHGHVPSGGRRWIMFRGCIVMAAFSFGHHGIRDGDHLYVVRPRSPANLASAHSFPRSGTIPWSRGLLRGGNALVMEASRLSDLASLMHSGPTRSGESSEGDAIQQHWRTVLGNDNPGNAEEPNEEPLPTCW
jgi:hypothetical protein